MARRIDFKDGTVAVPNGAGAAQSATKAAAKTARKRAPVDHRARARELRPQREQLPVFSARSAIVREVRRHPTVVIVGETGSGKTTQIPQYLLESGFTAAEGTAIAVTQPRRVAATSVAKRVAEEVGTQLGARVGYTIRFDDCSSDKTQLRFCTDGLLLREILSDPLLRRYSVVILDEAHERTLRTDILLGMLRDIQQRRQALAAGREARSTQHTRFDDEDADNDPEADVPELKIIVMSATLDADRFSEYFGGAPVLYVAGRQFPVTTYFTVAPQSDYLDAAHLAVLQIHTETPSTSGDILAFLAGQEDIESVERLLTESAAHLPSAVPRLLVCPIFAALPQAQQVQVFEPAPEFTRKVILATNIAETSLTIPGIRHVVDVGVHKVRGFDPRVGESLLVEPVSKSSARQRAGRAGREAPGFCYRLYTEADYAQLAEDAVPEIKRCQLTMVALQLKAAGVSNVLKFGFMDAPPKRALKHALLELYALEALDDRGELTALGRWMAEFPLDPSYSKAIYASQAAGCTREVIDIVSLLSVDSLFYVPADKRDESNQAQSVFRSRDGDHLTYLNLLRAYLAADGDAEWCREHFVNRRNMRHVLDVRQQLGRLCARLSIDTTQSCGTDLDPVLKCFLSGFFHNCALLQPDGSYRSLNGSQTVHVHPGSSLFGKKVPAIFYDQLVFTNRLHARAVTATDPLWIAQASPKLYGRLAATTPAAAAV
ncbi:Salivary acidic proline-rich phosphoprotein 1/2 [Coemansia spiralis]|nr:Salivary acidic proline-rich phosphoprotein 1/2 [Coemansia spiralis]